MDTSPLNLVLAGFMGAGKTVVGRELASLLGWRFIDLDAEIERQAGIAVSQIFETVGEPGFRARETRAIASLARVERTVVAAGGGAVVSAENRDRLHRIGTIVCLEAPPSVLWDRVQASATDRPLAGDRTTFMALLDRRKAFYRELPYHVPTRHRSPGEVARTIGRLFCGRSRSVRVELGERGYDVLVAPGGLNWLGDRMADVLGPGRCLVVSHPVVWRRHGEAALASLRERGWLPHVALVPAGEGSKSLKRALELYDEAVAARLERRHPVVAVGGGVAGDLGGFVASTYLRGVPFVQVPTTLLAQIDSAVGGKVGVNLAAGKNLVGSFYQPALVLADPLALHTLPEREFRSGLAELIKYGVILDAGLFARVEDQAEELLDRPAELLVELIARACELKAQVVAEDEREGSRRRILNFGHTVGHAIEQAAGYGRVLHGEAVAVGMVAATRLGERLGTCSAGLADRLASLLVRVGLPTRTDVPADLLASALRHDKKIEAGRIGWVLPLRLGSVAVRQDVAAEDVRAAIGDCVA